MKKLALSILLLLSLLGCTTPTGLFKDKQKASAEFKEVVTYCSNLDIDSQVKALNNKWGKNGGPNNQPSLEQLSNQSFATDKEKISINQISEIESSCDSRLRQWAQSNASEALPLVDEYILQKHQISASLYGKKISYGEANTRKQKLDITFVNAMKELDSKIYANQKAEQNKLIDTLIQLNNGPSPQRTCITTGNVTQCN